MSVGRIESPAAAVRFPYLVLPIIVIVALYAPTLDDGWHFDDLEELEWSGARELRPEAPRTHYRGIVVVWTWAANYRVSGEDPWSYHAFNVLVHLLVSLLVYAVTLELIQQLPRTRPDATSARRIAATASLLFAAHPLATQSVSYVTQRSTALGALFTLAALVLYSIARRGQTSWRRYGLLTAAVLTYQVALHTKHIALTLPVLMLAFELLASTTVRSLRSRLLSLLPFAFLAVLRIVDFAPRHLTGAVAAPNVPTPARADYALTQIHALVTYAKLALLPVGQNIDHDFPLSRSLSEPSVLISLIILVTFGLLAAWLARRAPVSTFGMILFVVALLPTSSFVPSRDLFFEHRAYLSLAGFSIAAACGLSRIGRLWPTGSVVLPAAVVLVLSLLTISRNRVWSSEVALWSDSVAKSPSKFRPHVNLGLALQNVGRLREAERLYLRALEIDPADAVAKNNLANIARSRNEYDRAAKLLEEAIEERPGYFEAHLNLGNVLLALGLYDEAEVRYRRALEIEQASIPARYNLAKCHEKAGRWEEAIRGFREVVAVQPDDAQFVNDLGCAYLAAGHLGDAEQALRRAIAARPSWAVPHYNLSLALEALGRDEAADVERKEAARLGLRLTGSSP